MNSISIPSGVVSYHLEMWFSSARRFSSSYIFLYLYHTDFFRPVFSQKSAQVGLSVLPR